jgi:hypothetical protein
MGDAENKESCQKSKKGWVNKKDLDCDGKLKRLEIRSNLREIPKNHTPFLLEQQRIPEKGFF